MRQVWRTEKNGDLSAAMFDVKPVIQNGNRFPRFLLLGRSHGGSAEPEVLLESGCEDDVPTTKARAIARAMKRARMSDQI
jgi:hypothetical protein